MKQNVKNAFTKLFAKKGVSATCVFLLSLLLYLAELYGIPQFIVSFFALLIVNLVLNVEKDKRNEVWEKVKEFKRLLSIADGVITMYREGPGASKEILDEYVKQTEIVKLC